MNNMPRTPRNGVKKAREAGLPEVYAPTRSWKDMASSQRPYGILKGVVDSKSFARAAGAEIVDVLKPQPGDIVVEVSVALCGFASTNLDFILLSRGIETSPSAVS